MNEIETLFDSIFKKKGGLLDTQSGFDEKNKEVIIEMKNNFQMIITHLKTLYPNLPDIHIDFIKNDQLNATAVKHENKYFIGINFGVYFLLIDMFNKILATKNNFPDIGNSDLETNEKKILNVITEDGGISFCPTNLDFVFPNDPLRRLYANFLTNQSVLFLILHECAHIINGHCGYLAERFNISELNEYDKNQEVQSYAIRQTLEMDADSFAVNHTLNIAFNNIKHFSYLSEFDKFIYKDLETFFKHWSAGIYLFFRLGGIDELDIERSKNRLYPPAYVRMGMVLSNIASIYLHYNLPALELLTPMLLNSISAAEEGYVSITFQKNMMNVFANNFLKAADYEKEITDNWNIVRPLVEPFAFGILPKFKEISS